MSSFSLELVALESFNLNEVLDQILDGELNAIASYEDIATEVGTASLMGMGEPPTFKIVIQFKDDPKDADLPKKLLKEIEKLLGKKGSVNLMMS